jgi:hypothetical protein
MYQGMAVRERSFWGHGLLWWFQSGAVGVELAVREG